jgi:phosphoribosyl 1,2-cyclic phosphate phosphodiesterase
MKVRILGCGSSGGVPRVGGKWGQCDPAEPKNRRRRVSVLIEHEGSTILIDTSPDLREQLLDAGTKQLDAVLFTHAHADHLHGIDDLRGLNRLMQRAIPVYASANTLDDIGQRFDYVFTPIAPGGSFYKPTLTPHAIEGAFELAGLPVVPFEQDHGFSKTLGFRIGGMAYSTDVVDLDDTAFEVLAGVELWIVDCLRYDPHPTHSHVAKTLSWIARVKPRRAVLTHMDTELDYATLRRILPPGVEPGYDGLLIEVGGG